MAYSDVSDAGFQISALKFGALKQEGGVRSTYEKTVEREIMGQVEEQITPISRPVSAIDARVIHAMKDGSSAVLETATPANTKTEFKAADAGAGSVEFGPMVANGVTGTHERNRGGFEYEQEFVFQGTALTETYSF